MGSPTQIPRNDPRARTLLGACLAICCGFFVVELIAHLALDSLGGGGLLADVLRRRFRLLSLGRSNLAYYAGLGLLIHAGAAALMSATLQRLWLRNKKLALSVVLLLFVAFQGCLVAMAMGEA